MIHLLVKTKIKYPGADIDNFRSVIERTQKIIEAIDSPILFSPYSIVPIVSQIIGLELPLMGSGKSPYSIISIISQGKDKNRYFLKKEFELSTDQKREIINEIYDMLAPYLLGEKGRYIELLIATKYKRYLENYGKDKIAEFKKILNAKFLILESLIKKFQNSCGDFAHIAHYGYIDDLYREQDFLKEFRDDIAKEWTRNSYPVVIEVRISGFEAVKEEVRGWVIFIPNSTEELFKDETLRKKKLLQCTLLAKKLGARIIGMAGLIASFSRGGYYVSKRINDISLTTGHAYTIGNITRIAKKILSETNLKLSECIVAIIGAAGSIGSGTAKLLAEEGVRRFILIDTANMVSSSKLQQLQLDIKGINKIIETQVSSDINAIKAADLVIVATNSPKTILRSEHLKSGAIVIDDSFPKNVSQEMLEEREDIILLEGGITQLPVSLDVDVARNVPDLMDVPMIRLVSCKQIYSCFAETLILAATGHEGDYGLGTADPKLAKDIMKKANSLKFSLASLQSFGLAIGEKRLQRVKQILDDVD